MISITVIITKKTVECQLQRMFRIIKEPETGMTFLDIDGEDVQPCMTFVGVDPATDSMRRDSDFSVVIVIAVTPNNNIYVLFFIIMKFPPIIK